VSRKDGIVVALMYDRPNGIFAWSRIITKGGVGVGEGIKSVAVVPTDEGYDAIYFEVKRATKYYLEALHENSQVFLDCWKPWAGSRTGYDANAVVFDATDGKVYKATEAPPPIAGHTMVIGWPYDSVVRSMPQLTELEYQKKRITHLDIRFHKSHMPKVKSIKNGVPGREDSITGKPAPYTGIAHLPFPGGYAEDAQFEILDSSPHPVKILAVNADVI